MNQKAISHPSFLGHEAGTRVHVSPKVERWEILLPAQLIVNRHRGLARKTASYDDGVSVRVGDGTCISNEKTQNLYHSCRIIKTYCIRCFSAKPGCWVPSGFISVEVSLGLG